MKINDIPELPVKGFMPHDEGLRLYELAKDASSFGACLEIGSYCGKSALYLGLGCRESSGILFSIDHHRGSEEQQPGQEYHDAELLDDKSGKIDTFRFFRQTLEIAGLEDTVVPIVSKSAVAARMWSTPLSLVFIDGSHAFESALVDYISWSSHIMPGGYLLMHDIFEDPKDGGQAPYEVYKIAAQSGLFRELKRTGSLRVLKRLIPGEIK
ncbi:MAG TPA: class I SAM-dependent methyltransferase [Desulfomonilia bacterium]